MKKLLIALDYNPSAQKVAETGITVARAMNAEVILLHVMAEPTYYFSSQYSPIMGFNSFNNSNMEELVDRDDLISAALEFLEKTKEHLGYENIKTVVKEGDFGDIIIATAEEQSADIIVTGTHNRSGLDKILMGSVAEKVLKRSLIPVLIIPTQKEP
jgi:nucleotide-binding universal stress UspA family protein